MIGIDAWLNNSFTHDFTFTGRWKIVHGDGEMYLEVMYDKRINALFGLKKTMYVVEWIHEDNIRISYYNRCTQ